MYTNDDTCTVCHVQKVLASCVAAAAAAAAAIAIAAATAAALQAACIATHSLLNLLPGVLDRWRSELLDP